MVRAVDKADAMRDLEKVISGSQLLQSAAYRLENYIRTVRSYVCPATRLLFRRNSNHTVQGHLMTWGDVARSE